MSKRSIPFIFLISLTVSLVVIQAGSFYISNSRTNSKTGVDQNDAEKNDTEKIKNQNLNSFFRNKNDYEAAFSSYSGIEKRKILAGITSHHFLAKNLIADFFMGIDGSEIKNIILIGPDHYEELNKKGTDVATTKLSWDTPYGRMDPDLAMQDKMLSMGNVAENDSIFRSEHSIYTLIPFIKKSFPNVQIIPLILRSSNDYGKFINIGNDTRKLADDKTLLIVSSDFSHNASVVESQKNDQISIENLKYLNEKNINNIISDCKVCVAFLYGFLKNDQGEFYLSEDKNSSDFGSRDETVTSYVSGYFLPKF